MRTQHHELTGGKLSRITKNAVKLSAVFQDHGNPFESTDEDDLFNLLTKAVINETNTNDILRRDEIGQQAFESFVTERLTEGKFSVWDKMTKKETGYFQKSQCNYRIPKGRQGGQNQRRARTITTAPCYFKKSTRAKSQRLHWKI